MEINKRYSDKIEREDVVEFVVKKLGCCIEQLEQFEDDSFAVRVFNKQTGLDAILFLTDASCKVMEFENKFDKDVKLLWARHVYCVTKMGNFSKLFLDPQDELTK